jgi:hypothetical protein
MPGKRGAKKKQGAKLPDSSGQTQTTAEISHAFAATDTGKKKSRLSNLTKKQRLLVGTAVVLLAVIFGVVVWQTQSDPEPPKTEYTSEGIKLRKVSQEKLQTEVDTLVFDKKYNSAREFINFQDYANTREAQIAVASVYINQGAHGEAIKTLIEAEKKYGQNWQVAKIIVQQYQIICEKELASTYYKKALELLKKAKDVPLKQDEIQFLEADIKGMEG